MFEQLLYPGNSGSKVGPEPDVVAHIAVIRVLKVKPIGEDDDGRGPAKVEHPELVARVHHLVNSHCHLTR